jgi:hypothetical protein
MHTRKQDVALHESVFHMHACTNTAASMCPTATTVSIACTTVD